MIASPVEVRLTHCDVISREASTHSKVIGGVLQPTEGFAHQSDH
jgi:hypothetical protein